MLEEYCMLGDGYYDNSYMVSDQKERVKFQRFVSM